MGKRHGGRSKGTPNKVGAFVRESIAEAFERIGGAERLAECADENPGEFFRHVWAKLCPKPVELSGPNGGPIQTEEAPDVSKLTKADLKKLRDLAGKIKAKKK